MGALDPLGLDDRLECVQPFPRLLRVGVRLVDDRLEDRHRGAPPAARARRASASFRSPRPRGTTSVSAASRPPTEALPARAACVGVELLGPRVALDRQVLAARLRYWPMVTKSTSASRMSSSVASTSARVSPSPSMIPDLVKSPGLDSFDLAQQFERVAVVGAAPGARVEPWHRLEVVVVDVGSGPGDAFGRTRLAQEVGRQHLDGGAGRGAANRLDAAHEVAAPPSGRSSRSTEVTTTCLSSSRRTASARRTGSS